MTTQKIIPVSCPQCATKFNAPVEDTIDGQNLSQKSAFLQGRLNFVRCPQCGLASPLTAPILYYDLAKELAFVFLPNGLMMTNADQERLIGSLTNGLINSLPTEQRKFYLLNPKPFLSMDSLLKAILEADGITPERFEAQKAKIQLLEDILKIDNEVALQAKVKENDHLLDREFFEIVTASMQAAQQEGNPAGAQALFALRGFLAQASSRGQQAVDEIDAELGIVYVKGMEDLLNKLQQAKSAQEFEQWVAAGHELIDYQFFQRLTERIDAATAAGDKKKEAELKTLRAKILETKGRQEEQGRAAIQKAAHLLREILQAKDPMATLKSKLGEIDETFFALLSANIQEARRQKQNDMAQAMERLGNTAIALLQEQMAGSARPETEIVSPPASPKIHLP